MLFIKVIPAFGGSVAKKEIILSLFFFLFFKFRTRIFREVGLSFGAKAGDWNLDDSAED